MNAAYFYIATIAAVVAVISFVTYIINITDKPTNDPNAITKTSYEILKTYNVDSRYFYQGLEFIEGVDGNSHLLMSEGWYGSSALGIMDINDNSLTIQKVANYPMNTQYFGEGATYFPVDGKIYQLTWKDNVLLVFDNLIGSGLRPTFVKEIPLPDVIGEGWGITHDSEYLYISNGSQTIFVCLPNAAGTGLDVVRLITVDAKGRYPHFNEIEMVDSQYIYANAYLTNDIYKFSKSDGTLLKIWSLPGLMKIQRDNVYAKGQQSSYDWGNNVLNGIAYNPLKQTFLLTGKRWDFMFEVKLKEE